MLGNSDWCGCDSSTVWNLPFAPVFGKGVDQWKVIVFRARGLLDGKVHIESCDTPDFYDNS